MIDRDENREEVTETALTVNTDKLNKESLELINKIIAEDDVEKSKDLTYLFNQNQNKKTITRVNKLNDLQDVLVTQALERFTKRPDEIDNNTLIQAMKTTQEMIERGQKQVTEAQEESKPLIQINQQNTEINLDGKPTLTKESRDKVNKIVSAILGKVATHQDETTIPADFTETDKGDQNGN